MREILRIVIGNICITSAYAFITVPRHVVNGGVTSFSMILHVFLPVDISVITNCVTVVLLGICLYFLGKAFLMKSFLSIICYMVMFIIFHAIGYRLSIPVLPAIILAAILVGIGYYLCISASSSTVGFDVLALVLHKRYEKLDVAITMRYINIGVILLGFASYGGISILIGIGFTILQTQVLKLLLQRNEQKIQEASCDEATVSKCIVKS